MINNELWAWLAGFLDGEGSFYPILEHRKNNKTGFMMQTVVDVSNTNRDTLLKVLEITQCGKLHICNKQRKNHKIVWKVHFNKREVIEIIPKIEPFLVGRKLQANLLFKLACNTSGRGRRYTQEMWDEIISIYNQIRSLNKRGTIPYVSLEPNLIRPSFYRKSDRRCSIEGCFQKHYGKGYCRKHYRKLTEYKKRNRSMVHQERNLLN